MDSEFNMTDLIDEISEQFVTYNYWKIGRGYVATPMASATM